MCLKNGDPVSLRPRSSLPSLSSSLGSGNGAGTSICPSRNRLDEWATVGRSFGCMPVWDSSYVVGAGEEDEADTTIAPIGSFVTPSTIQPRVGRVSDLPVPPVQCTTGWAWTKTMVDRRRRRAGCPRNVSDGSSGRMESRSAFSLFVLPITG